MEKTLRGRGGELLSPEVKEREPESPSGVFFGDWEAVSDEEERGGSANTTEESLSLTFGALVSSSASGT